MNELLIFLEKFWALIVPICIGIGSAYEWNRRRKAGIKKAEKQSTEMLYVELEDLKQKVINQVSREVDLATKLSEKETIIMLLAQHCPDCYKRVIDKINS